MPHNPLEDVAEILGEPAKLMRSPANADYQCPYLNGACTKKSHNLTSPFPVCSIYRRRGDRPPICVCPNRFLEAQLQEDVIRECWTGDPPANPVLVGEVSMKKFGKVDFVVADIDPDGTTIRNFISVELQAVDITGSYLRSYEAITNNEVSVQSRPTYGFNWANVRKRFLSQIIAKGFHHFHWGTRIVAIMQQDLFEEFQKHATIPAVSMKDANIVFLLYQFKWSADRWTMAFLKAVPTTHAGVMMASLYTTQPKRAEFEARILARMRS